MKQISVGELKKRLSDVLREVHNECLTYEVTSRGKVIARLTPEYRETTVEGITDEEIEAWLKADEERLAKYADEAKGPPIDAVQLLRGYPKGG